MAKVAHTRKSFQFRIELSGVDQFEVQKVTLPEIEIDAVEHGDTNRVIKTPGMIKTGDLVFEKVRPLGNDMYAWDRLSMAQNPLTGGGELPIVVKHPIIIKEMDTTGMVTLNKWVCSGCWIKKISSSDLDRTSSDNIIETITFSVDECIRV